MIRKDLVYRRYLTNAANCKLPKNDVLIESKAQDFSHAKDPNVLQNSNYETMVVAVAMF